MDSQDGQPVPYPALKCATDKLVAAVLIVLLAPVFFLVLVAMALDMVYVPADRGSWLYRERRISRGREFDLLKFRALKDNVLAEADVMKQDLLVTVLATAGMLMIAVGVSAWWIKR